MITLSDDTMTKQKLTKLVRTSYEIPSEHSDLFTDYYMLYWSGEYLREQNIEGTITHDWSIRYNIVFYGCTPEQAYAATQVRVSFRAPITSTGVHPVALVSVRR